MTTQEIEERIALLKNAIKILNDYEKKLDRNFPKMNIGNAQKREIELLEAGVTNYAEHPAGFIINGNYIIALNSNKWRVLHKIVWYRFKSVPHLVQNYINKI